MNLVCLFVLFGLKMMQLWWNRSTSRGPSVSQASLPSVKLIIILPFKKCTFSMLALGHLKYSHLFLPTQYCESGIFRHELRFTMYRHSFLYLFTPNYGPNISKFSGIPVMNHPCFGPFLPITYEATKVGIQTWVSRWTSKSSYVSVPIFSCYMLHVSYLC